MELFALARFGRWDDLTMTEAPPPDWRYTTGVWHYVRGMAYAARGALDNASAELAAVRKVAVEPALTEMTFASGATPKGLLAIGRNVLAARIVGEAGHWAEAIPLLVEAVAMQDALPYTEPPPWYFPTREALGYALLEAGRAGEAEEMYEEQLARTPRNGWSLFGLAASQRAQGKSGEAEATEEKLAEVWERADFRLEGAVF